MTDVERVTVDEHGSTAVLRMANGALNLLDIEMLEALDSKLDELHRADLDALIITGNESAFSAGVDLRRVLAGGRAYVEEFVPALSGVFHALFTFPRPVVAAIGGHAIAGGCVLVCASDVRVMAVEHGRIGLSELRVGVPFPPIALEIVRARVGSVRLRRIVMEMELYRATSAREMGLIDETCDTSPMTPAFDAANRLSRIPGEAFRLTKDGLNAPFIRLASDPVADENIVRQWSSDSTLAAIESFTDSL